MEHTPHNKLNNAIFIVQVVIVMTIIGLCLCQVLFDVKISSLITCILSVALLILQSIRYIRRSMVVMIVCVLLSVAIASIQAFILIF